MVRSCTPSVLHVDDDAGVRRAVARALSSAGFSVVSVADGAAGLEAARRRRFDLVVLDVDLPDISGFEVCQRLRADARTRKIPIMHLSGARISLESRVEGLDSGADAYLVHPVPPEELVATARALVRARRQEARAHRATRESAVAAREDAVAVVAQALGASLTALAIQGAGLLASASAGDPVARARAEMVVEAAQGATRIVSELVELARLEARQAPLATTPCDVHTIVERAAGRVEPLARSKGVAIDRDVPQPGEVIVPADAERLEAALAQVLSDAVRVTPEGRRVRVRARQDAAGVRISVEDDGTANEDDDRALLPETIWEPRGRRRVRIGVALARAIVEAHGGQIWMSGVGRGSAVHVALPSGAAPRPEFI